MNKELVAVVLAGGAGNRFWPFSSDKILFPWFGRPFIEYSVTSVLPSEVSRVVIVTNSGNNTAIANMKFPVPSMTVVQPNAHGMADALLSASSQLKGSALLILNGDDLNDANMLSQVVKKGIKSDAFGVIPGFKVDHYQPFGFLAVDGERLLGIVEKPGAGNEPSQWAVALGHYISDSDVLLSELRQTGSSQDDVYEKTLSTLMKRYPFLLHAHVGTFATLKYPWHVLDVTDILLHGLKPHRGKNVDMKSNVVIEGKVYIDDDVRIFENTKIVGPCYIGKGTIIGNNNIIRQSHIGAGSVTGFNTDITRSYVGDHCWFHSNYIGDSVVEGNISMGAGAVFANLRLDEGDISSIVNEEIISTGKTKLGAIVGSDVRIGVNASIMPGIKIGRGSFVGSGVILDKDLPQESYCIAKSAFTVTRNNKNVARLRRDEFKKQL